ncbi:MAG: leader peptidase (prepilin peptidase)/N-methyltransferase [Mariniblastus sp.]|jgi:leader peptidase (prepilin peptidase)/N-methyltransferase
MKINSNLIRVLKLATWLFVALVVLLLLVLPLLTSVMLKTGNLPIKYVQYLVNVEIAQAYLMMVLGCLWIFFLGSCFASFLNVVAWRTPRGRGINGSSHCPFCHNKLRFGDNLPIIGWLRNMGQCRDCRLPIAPRYLIVEFILGAIFLAICGLEILGGGLNLPFRELERLRGFEHLVFVPKWDLIQLSIFHLCLVCFLFAFALIRSEGLKIPVSVFVAGIFAGVVLPLIWPAMLLVAWQLNSSELIPLNRFSIDQLLTMGVGLGVGLACGLLCTWGIRPESQVIEQNNRVEQSTFVADGLAAMALVGIFLGWQSGLSIALIALCLSLISIQIPGLAWLKRFNFSTRVLAATIVHLATWRVTTELGIWPSQNASVIVIAVAVIALGVVACACRMRKIHSVSTAV